MKKVNRTQLAQLLTTNVCEITFVRRRPERAKGRPLTRKMLCSNSMDLLNSQNGKLSLNFRLPGGPKKIDEMKHNVVVAWDIFIQDYINISCDSVYLLKEIPANDEFWKYYNEVLIKMSPDEKLQFMDS